MNQLNPWSIHHGLLPLDPRACSTTQFVPSSPVSASPLMVIKCLSQSEDGLIKILRLIESSVKSYVYLTTWIRPSHLKSPNNPARLGTARILIGLSFISIIQRFKELIKITQTKFSKSQSSKFESLIHLQESSRRSSSSNQLKSTLESASHSLEIIVNLLDHLTFLNHLGLLKFRSVKNISNQVSNVLNVMLNVLNYSKTSIEKAELWKIGRDTRTLMIETDRIIKCSKRAVQSPSNLSLSPVSSTIRPAKHDADEESLNQPSSLQDKIDLDLRINRSRKLILKNCKQSLDRIFWSRIIFLIDGLVSAYDLLEFQCVSHGLRTLIELMGSILDVRLSYAEALQSYSTEDQLSRQTHRTRNLSS